MLISDFGLTVGSTLLTRTLVAQGLVIPLFERPSGRRRSGHGDQSPISSLAVSLALTVSLLNYFTSILRSPMFDRDTAKDEMGD